MNQDFYKDPKERWRHNIVQYGRSIKRSKMLFLWVESLLLPPPSSTCALGMTAVTGHVCLIIYIVYASCILDINVQAFTRDILPLFAHRTLIIFTPVDRYSGIHKHYGIDTVGYINTIDRYSGIHKHYGIDTVGYINTME